jgi:hypothetical protein
MVPDTFCSPFLFSFVPEGGVFVFADALLGAVTFDEGVTSIGGRSMTWHAD